MTVSLTFSQSIESDYSIFKDIIYRHSHFNCDTNHKFKIVHSKIYLFKELFTGITMDPVAEENILESINGQIEFLWLISIGKYKVASMSYRGATENFSKGIAYQLALSPTNKFAENIDISIKRSIEQISSANSLSTATKKSFAKEFRKLLLDPIKQSYWDLCDIVHSRDQSFNSCKEFLEDILEPKHDNNQLDALLDLIINISNYIIIIFYYSNFQSINSEINLVKLDLITNTFPSSFDSIKEFLL